MAKKKVVTHTRRWLHLLWATPLGIIGLLAVLIVFLPEPQYTDRFRTLNEIKTYADTLDEWVEMENDKIFAPTYAHYYEKKFDYSFCTRINKKLKWLLKNQPLPITSQPSLNFFEQLLHSVTESRTKQKMSGDFIQKIELSENSTLIVLGPLYGAFHSLTRDLNELMKLNIIDNNLKLTNQNTAIAFLGNAVTKSAFCLETFLVILKIMQTNPNQIIYIKGHQEIESQWRAQSLYQELALAFPGKKLFTTHMEQKVDAFFNTLPIAAYCTLSENNETQYLKLVYSAIKEDTLSLDDENLPEKAHEFLTQRQSQLITTFKLNNSLTLHETLTQHTPKAHTKVIISGFFKRDDLPDTQGFTLIAPVNKAKTWRLASSPTARNRKIFGVLNDAFIISQFTTLEHSQITLYYRDAYHTHQKFNKKLYQLF